jgi:hypothetical protein
MTNGNTLLLLHGTCPLRQLELTLDSIVGQTDPDFTLMATPAQLGVDGAALLVRYFDARLLVAPDSGALARDYETIAVLQAGAVLLPTWLARLRAALDAAPQASLAACGCTLFDGVKLRRGPSAGPDGAALAADPVLAMGALLRTGRLGENLAISDVAGDLGGVVAHLLIQGPAVCVPARLLIRRVEGEPARPQRRLATRLHNHDYVPADIEAERPPTLYVVVDTEAEFDWDKPFAANLTQVSAIAAVESAQAIFDRYGLRPVYVIDYPIAGQATSIAALRPIVERGAAVIGAHLHPWTNPPHDTPIDHRLSFPGNLPEAAEAAKLDALLAKIEENFGSRPAFYKAGRYGLGANTARLIAARGARVDFSLMPETDLRDEHGPDFRMVAAYPYIVPELGLLAVPMTRADVGPLSRWWTLRAWLDTQTAALLRVRAFLVRAGLLERLTLTPEGVDARLQVVLLQTLLRRGHQLFVLHFHSPSLAPGHTPYVRTEAERVEFLKRIDTVCRWFFEELGGVPGRPHDLLPVENRGKKNVLL